MKQIRFIPELIEKLRSENPPQCTYRKTARSGLYQVVSGPWIKPKPESIIIYVSKSEQVNPQILTDADAQLAGVESLEKLHMLFRRWYHDVPNKMYRNWLTVVNRL